jgi:hypothetical protein
MEGKFSWFSFRPSNSLFDDFLRSACWFGQESIQAREYEFSIQLFSFNKNHIVSEHECCGFTSQESILFIGLM